MSDQEHRLIRRTVIFRGNVQGVGFRYTARTISVGFPITGYVRNLADGTVELVIEGTRGDADGFTAEIRRVMRNHITDISCIDDSFRDEFNSFEIAH